MRHLKQYLEMIRGEGISVYDGDPLDIPCRETSDFERLCQHPVVSVVMITYNHAAYIRQAIEGVMMQKTNFEFELLIGEDCSKDGTREICFEYQRRYPESIRVLWANVNVYRLGGNGRRCRARTRGEFIAFCEGDDYWTDPLKLQKQVDAMRKHPTVGICFCGSRIKYVKDGVTIPWDNEIGGVFQPGLIPSRKYMLYSMLGKKPFDTPGNEFFQMTATFMLRQSVLEVARNRYDIFRWNLRVGDSVQSLGVGSISDAYYLCDEVSVYRQVPTGATFSNAEMGVVDTYLIRLYFWVKVFSRAVTDVPEYVRRRILIATTKYKLRMGNRRQVRHYICVLLCSSVTRKFVLFPSTIAALTLALIGVSGRMFHVLDAIWCRYCFPCRGSRLIRAVYEEANCAANFVVPGRWRALLSDCNVRIRRLRKCC